MSLEAYRAHQGTMRAFLDSQGQVMARLLSLEKALKTGDPRAAFYSFQSTALRGFRPAIPFCKRCRFRWADTPSPRDQLPPRVTNPGLTACFWLFRALPNIAASLERLLGEKGALAATLPVISLSSPDALKSAAEEIRARLGPIAGIVFAQGIGRDRNARESRGMAESKPDRGQSVVFSSASLRKGFAGMQGAGSGAQCDGRLLRTQRGRLAESSDKWRCSSV